MAEKTLTTRLIDYVLTFTEEVKSRSHKYRCFKYVNKDGNVGFYHIGKSGAVRVSKNGSITGSFSISDHVRFNMTQWEEKQFESNQNK